MSTTTTTTTAAAAAAEYAADRQGDVHLTLPLLPSWETKLSRSLHACHQPTSQVGVRTRVSIFAFSAPRVGSSATRPRCSRSESQHVGCGRPTGTSSVCLTASSRLPCPSASPGPAATAHTPPIHQTPQVKSSLVARMASSGFGTVKVQLASSSFVAVRSRECPPTVRRVAMARCRDAADTGDSDTSHASMKPLCCKVIVRLS
jgi:hypothetical protein